MGKLYDVYGLGNAIVDIELRVSDDELLMLGLKKGLIEFATHEEQEHVIQLLKSHVKNEAAGGSTANTMVGVAKFGGSPCFIGKVGSDGNGNLYKESLKKNGVEYSTESASGPTGTCCVSVSYTHLKLPTNYSL